MPARDLFHTACRRSLEKDGWTITHDPYPLKIDGQNMSVDLGAEQVLAATKGIEQIAVEIKSFLAPSKAYDFYNALGQFLSYKAGLEEQEPQRVLYLAITDDVYDDYFQRAFPQKMVERYDIRLLVYDAQKEVVLRWIN